MEEKHFNNEFEFIREKLNEIDTIVFDKTGTLTKGVFNVQKVVVIDKNIKEKIKEFKDEKAVLFYKNGEVAILEVSNSIDLSNILKEYLKKDLEYFYIRGAITPKIIEAFINSRGNYEKITLLAEDGTKFFINSSLLNKAKLSGIEFKVLNKINLLFVTINPHSPLGVDFNKEEFKTRLQKEISVPVINVLGD